MPGSSPRVRGKLSREDPARLSTGLIPACAGKTSRQVTGRPKFQAHPRVCGENLYPSAWKETNMGSSPRVRGKRVWSASFAIVEGLIPACAGKTLGRVPGSAPQWAHPRVCGENEGVTNLEVSAPGSSPRVRGKPLIPLSPLSHTGLIPACAGKTTRSESLPGLSWAHPRVCGENCRHEVPPRRCQGSSPRVRGKL